MNKLEVRCLMCGKVYGIGEDHRDYKKVSESKTTATFICDFCSNRVRYESDEQQKPKKPV